MINALFVFTLLASSPVPCSTRVAVQGRGSVSLLQPAQHASPSGEFVLHVDPTERQGGGPGNYRMVRRGEVCWERQLPVTLWAAGITDSGYVAGYAYSAGYLDGLAKGSFHVLIIDPEGNVIADDVTKRERGRGFSHSVPDPNARALVVHEGIDRVLVELKSGSLVAQGDWRAYRLSTGERLDDWPLSMPFQPTEKERLYCFAAHLIPSTELVLCHWWFRDSSDYSMGYSREGGVFSLVDIEGRTVWSLERRRDYTVENDEAADDALKARVQEDGAILASGPGASFSLWFPAENSRATFSVTKAGSEWNVVQVETATLASQTHALPEYPTLHLEQVGEVRLGSAESHEHQPLGGIRAFGFTDDGIHEVIRGEKDDELHYQRLSVLGDVLLDVPLRDLPQTEHGLRWFDGPGDSWYAVAHRYPDWANRSIQGATTSIYRVDVRGSVCHLLPTSDLPNVTRLIPLRGGGFVVLGNYHTKYQVKSGLLAFDVHGGLAWRVDEGAGGAGALLSPNDITVTRDDVLVVVDSIRDQLQLYSATGSYLRSIDLATAWGEDPAYPSRVVADGEGAVWITDSTSLWHMTLEGELLGRLPRTLGIDSAFRIHSLRVSADGNLWYSDGTMLASFTKAGDAGATIGRPPSVDQLQQPSMAWIDFAGRIIVEDRRSGAWHVFEHTGKKLFTCPPPESFRPASFSAWRGGPRQSPTGEQIGPAAPRPGVSWHGEGRGELRRLDERGTELSRLSRDAANLWWPRIWAFGLSAGATRLAVMGSDSTLSVFDGDGNHGRLYELPGVSSVQLAASEHWVALADSSTDVCLLDLSSGTLHRLEIDESEHPWRWGFSPSGDELWGLNIHSLVLQRFAMPRR